MTPAAPGFLVAPCPTCERRVLSGRDLDHDGELILVCIHCGGRLDPAEATAGDAAELDELGYDVGETPQSVHGERGCRDGQCGIRQPDSC